MKAYEADPLSLMPIAAAAPAETSLSKSPDGRYEIFLTGDDQEGRIIYFDVVIREAATKELIPIARSKSRRRSSKLRLGRLPSNERTAQGHAAASGFRASWRLLRTPQPSSSS